MDFRSSKNNGISTLTELNLKRKEDSGSVGKKSHFGGSQVSSRDENGSQKQIGLERFKRYVPQNLPFDPSRYLENMEGFYTSTTPNQINLLSANKFVQKDATFEENAKGFLEVGIKLLDEHKLGPFYNPDCPATVPDIPDRETIRDFLNERDESKASKTDKKCNRDGILQQISSQKEELKSHEERMAKLRDIDVSNFMQLPARLLSKLTASMVCYDKEIGTIYQPDPLPLNIEQMELEEQAQLQLQYQTAAREASYKRDMAKSGYAQEIIDDDISEIKTQCLKIGAQIQQNQLALSLINEKEEDFNTKNIKEADKLIEWHNKAKTKYEETNLVIIGTFKAMITEYLTPDHAQRLKTQLNELYVEDNVVDSYDSGDLYHMLLILELHHASSKWMAGWNTMINFAEFNTTPKQDDEEFRAAYDRQADLLIKAIGSEYIKVKDMMCVLLLHRSHIGSAEFLSSMITRNQVLDSKPSFKEMQPKLQAQVQDYLSQKNMCNTTAKAQKKGNTKDDKKVETKTEAAERVHRVKYGAFMADSNATGLFKCNDPKGGATCRFGAKCRYAHTNDPKFLSDKTLCKELGRTRQCTRSNCKRDHAESKYPNLRPVAAATAPTASAPTASAPRAPSATTAPNTVPRQNTPAVKAPPPAYNPAARGVAFTAADDDEDYPPPDDNEDGFAYGMMLQVVEESVDISAQSAVLSAGNFTGAASTNTVLHRALWDSGAVKHITGQEVSNPKTSNTKIRGIGGTVHHVKAQGTYGNKTDVLQMPGAAATIFSVSQMVKPTAEGDGIVIMDNKKAVLIRGEFAASLMTELLARVKAEESATLRNGMYVDNIYVGTLQTVEPQDTSAVVPTGEPQDTSAVVPTVEPHASAVIQVANNRVKVAGGPNGYIDYLIGVGLLPEQIKMLQKADGWPPEVTEASIRRYFLKHPAFEAHVLAMINSSPLRVPRGYLKIRDDLPGLIMQMDGLSPDFSRNTTGEMVTVHGKKIKPNMVIPSIGGAIDAVLIGDVATCGLFIRARKSKKYPYLLLIEFAIKWITLWGELRFICCDLEFITTESLKWCSQYNVIIRASPPGDRLHAMNTGFIEGMVRHTQDAGQVQMNMVKTNTELSPVRQIQFWYACCQQAVLLSLLRPSPHKPDIMRYEEIYGQQFNMDTTVLLKMATKIIAFQNGPTPHGRGSVFYYMNASPLVQGGVIAISPETGLTSIKYSFAVPHQHESPPVPEQELLKMWPTPTIVTKITSEDFTPPVFENFPIAPPLADFVQPEGWTVSDGVQEVLQRELVEPVMKEQAQEERYSLRSSKRARSIADEEQKLAHIMIAYILLDGTYAEMDPLVMLLDGTELVSEPVVATRGPPPAIPPAAVRRNTPQWTRAQQRERVTLSNIVQSIPAGEPLPFGCTILDMKEVPEWKWKPHPDEELDLEQRARVQAGEPRPTGWLACVRWVLRGFKDKRQNLVTFAETPDTSFVWWLIGYYVAMKQPVVTSDLIRAYLNAVEPGTIVVQADRYMQHAGMAKYSRALYNMYGKKDAARVFQDWLNDLLVNTLGWKRMNTGTSCYKLPGAPGDMTSSAIRHSDDIATMGPTALQQLQALQTITRMNPIAPISTFLGVEVVRYNSKSFEPDEEGTIIAKSVYNKLRDICQETLERRKFYNPTRKVRTTALPPKFKTFEKPGHWSEPADVSDYKHLIGLLVFVVKNVRGDISYAFRMLAGKLHAPCEWDVCAALWCIDYLEATIQAQLLLGGDVVQATMYMDAAYATEDKGRSVLFWYLALSPDSGFTECRCTITDTSVLSAYESEIMVFGDAIDNIQNVDARNQELELPGLALGIDVYGDNKTEINWLNGEVVPNRARHITTRYYAVRELVEQGRLRCHWIEGANNPADLGTKLLSGPITRKHSAHMLGHRLMKGAKKSFLLQIDA